MVLYLILKDILWALTLSNDIFIDRTTWDLSFFGGIGNVDIPKYSYNDGIISD